MNYGFGGRYKKEFPSQVIIDLTEVCNLACTHCPHPIFKKSSHYGARFLDGSLNQKAVDEVKSHGSQYIRYTAEGEPLIHPECHEFVQYAVEHSGTFVTLTTNGTLLNGRKMKRLLDSGLHMIDVSIDAATPETYAKVRGGEYAKVVFHVKQMAKMRGKCKLVVSFVEQPENAHEAIAFHNLWKPLVDQVVIRRFHSAAGHLKSGVQVDRYPCIYPWERIVLSPSGYLNFCPQEWFNGARLADYRATTIKEVWGSPQYEALRIAHLTDQCYGVCEKCPDWKQTRWHGESYSDLVETMK